LKQILIVLGILMVFGCADDSKQDQFESGCAESPSDGGSAVSSGGSGSGGGTDTSTPETCEYYSYTYTKWVQSDYYGEPISGGKQKAGQVFLDLSLTEWDGYFDSGRRDYKWDPVVAIYYSMHCYTGYVCINGLVITNIMVGPEGCKDNIPTEYTCKYFSAYMVANTGVFGDLWYESNLDGSSVVELLPSYYVDDDSDQDTLPTELALYGYEVAGTYDMTVYGSTTKVTGNVLKGPSGCSE
jgi:hypothetical protein